MQQLSRKYLHESNLIEGFDSAEADACLKKAWEYLMPVTPPGDISRKVNRTVLSDRTIKHVQALLTQHQTGIPDIWRGRYRSDLIPRDRRFNSSHGTLGRVWIAGQEAPSPALVDRMMEDWLAQFGDTTKEFDPIIAHIAFEKIHPFMDGNGRTGRLILWWQQKMKAQPYSEITYADRWDYYAWFN